MIETIFLYTWILLYTYIHFLIYLKMVNVKLATLIYIIMNQSTLIHNVHVHEIINFFYVYYPLTLARSGWTWTWQYNLTTRKKENKVLKQSDTQADQLKFTKVLHWYLKEGVKVTRLELCRPQIVEKNIIFSNHFISGKNPTIFINYQCSMRAGVWVSLLLTTCKSLAWNEPK